MSSREEPLTRHSSRSEDRKRRRQCATCVCVIDRENEELLRKYACVQKINELKKLDTALFERWSVNPAPFIPSFGTLEQSFQIENRMYRSPDKALVQEVYSLCKTNMEDMYNACSWKWNEKKECTPRSPV